MELIHISKTYNGRQVLKDLCAKIPDGSTCAVLGPSGCGKTTLLRLILGLEKQDEGSLLDVPAQAAVLFQEDRMLPELTLMKNLKMAVPQADRAEADKLVQMLALSGSEKMPLKQFSGGMARRAALLRALCAPGKLLVLDEPFTGLDEDNRAAAAEAILASKKGRTLIYTAHDAPEALLPKPDCILDLSV